MFSIHQTNRRAAPAELGSPLQLSNELAWQATELIGRLRGGQFIERKAGTRRADGEIYLATSGKSGVETAKIRLNSFRTGTSGVVMLELRGDHVEVPSFMRRQSEFGADDRSKFLVPTKPSSAEREAVENIISAACVCVGRGSVRIGGHEGAPAVPSGEIHTGVVMYELFLPSRKPLPYVDSDFVIRGLDSLY